MNIVTFTAIVIIVVVLLFILLLNKETNYNYPSHIVIIRHGEKPLDKKDFFLDSKGKDRAFLLSDWVKNTVPTFAGQVAAIYTPDPGPFSEDSRPRQTVSLAAFDNNISIIGRYRYFETEKAAEEILSNEYLKDKVVLVCWEHTCIQKLVDSLLRQNYNSQTSLPFWQSNDFSTVVVLTKKDDVYNISLTCEGLLPGDDEICAQTPIIKEQTCTTF